MSMHIQYPFGLSKVEALLFLQASKKGGPSTSSGRTVIRG